MKYAILFLMQLCTWSLQGQIFTKITDSPVSTVKGDSRSVNWVDVNGDNYVDCFITNGPQAGQNNMLYLNDTKGNFSAVANDPIVMDAMPSDGATFADIDNDGDLDAFVVNWYNRNNLAYLNDGTGAFTQVTEGTWVNHFGYSETAAFGDYDNDGLVDLYVTNSAGARKNFMYRNLGENQMEVVSEGPQVTDIGSSRNAGWTDFDNDGDLDLYVTNENNETNVMYWNDGAGVFEAKQVMMLTTDHYSTMSSSWGDMDNDGDLDLFLANDGSKNQLFRNEGNTTFNRILTTDISKNVANSFSSAWADIDNDGDLDLFVTNAFKNGVRLKNNLYLNDGRGHLTEVTDDPAVTDEGWSYGCAFGDYDNDGFLDLAVATTRFGNADEADYLYHNNGNTNHWLMLALEGKESNRSAIGARVHVKAVVQDTATWQMREISSQSAYCSQNDLRAHFGLGQASIVDSVVIEWPSGKVQHLAGLLPDQILEVKEELVNALPDELKSFSFNVFPNPATAEIHLEMQMETQIHDLILEIFSDTGQIVYRAEYTGVSGYWHEGIDLKKLNLIPGQYLVRINNGVSAEERIVILAR